MSLIAALISIAISGLIVGALGRLAIPGPNPMSIGMTILVGLGGAIVGGIIGGIISNSATVVVLCEVAVAALIVWLMQRNQHKTVT